MAGMSRSFVLNRAFVADRWMNSQFGIPLAEANEEQLRQFLRTVPASMRDHTWEALCAYGDDLIRKGQAQHNVARAVGMVR